MSARKITPPEDRILTHKENGVGWLTFNQPGRRNAMTLELWDGVSAAVVREQDDQGQFVYLVMPLNLGA